MKAIGSIVLAAGLALGLASCAKTPVTLDGSSSDPSDPGTDPGTTPDTGSSSSAGLGGPSHQATALDDRVLDYNEALRTASLKLVRALPTLEQIKRVAGASDQKVAYEAELDNMLADPRFAERMIKWWKDTLRTGGDAERDSAAIFAARNMVTGGSFMNLFTATNNTCPSYDAKSQQFMDGDCQNNVATHAGLLTHPGVMRQFFSNMAFRRVRWIQEVFICTKFPAEYSAQPVTKGKGQYTSPWPFESVANTPINFQDTSSVICANCHTTINHMAPLFGHFDDQGQWSQDIQVMTPVTPTPVKTEMSHWLRDGEVLSWRQGQQVADIPALGKAMTSDQDVADCAVTRAYDFAFSKQDVVTDLATVPPVVLKKYTTAFKQNNYDLKATLRSIMTSDDFVRF